VVLIVKVVFLLKGWQQPTPSIPRLAKSVTAKDLAGQWSYSDPNSATPGVLRDLDLRMAADGTCLARWSLHFGETFSAVLVISTANGKLVIDIPRLSSNGQTVPMFGRYALTVTNTTEETLSLFRIDPDEAGVVDCLVLKRRSPEE
jgi:hypothetical protein